MVLSSSMSHSCMHEHNRQTLKMQDRRYVPLSSLCPTRLRGQANFIINCKINYLRTFHCFGKNNDSTKNMESRFYERLIFYNLKAGY